MAIATAFLAFLLAAPPADQAPGYVGIQPAPLNAELRKLHKIADDVESGLVLLVVHEKTAAAKAGLRVGDVLTSFDNKPVKSLEDLLSLLKDKKAGDKVAYSARRGSGTIAGVLVLGRRPDEAEISVVPGKPAKPMREAPAQGDKQAELEARAKALEAEMEALRHAAMKRREAARKAMEMERAAEERAMKKRAEATPDRAKASGKAPRRFQDWIAREEHGLERAEQQKALDRIIWHKARLELLREMQETGWARRNQPLAGADRRVAQLEKRLEQVLERLERLEKRVK